MYITLQNHKMMITPTGQIFDGDSIFIDLLVDEDYLIEKLFIITTEEYLIAIYTDVNGSSTGSTAKKIMFQDNEVIWNVNIGGFNMATPVYDNKYLYLSSIGNICKLNFDTGEFDWKFENLYNNGKYNSFNKPEFLDNNMILFTSIREDDSGRIDSIIVDDLIKNIVVRK